MPNKKIELIYSDITYNILGAAFEVWKNIGCGYKEKVYQRAIAKEMIIRNIKFEEQLYTQLKYKDEVVGEYFFDFLVDNKIVVELKVRNYFSRTDIDQLYEYLKSKNLKLGLILHITRTGVKFKRIVNIN